MEQEDLSASICIKNRPNVWANDAHVLNCQGCGAQFGWLLTRKHHCRVCGQIFCGSCSKYQTVIPDFITDNPKPEDYWNPSYYLPILKSKEERACKKCFIMIQQKLEAHKTILELLNSDYSIERIHASSELSEVVRSHYIDHLRNIQYYMPSHQYTPYDKNLLQVNSKYFSRHSKYLMHLIKSIDWSNKAKSNTNLETIARIINDKRKTKKCSELYCTRTCHDVLAVDDCINILYSCANNLPDKLLRYLFDIIKESTNEIIKCLVPFLSNLIIKASNPFIIQLIYEVVQDRPCSIYCTYWLLLNNEIEATQCERVNINTFISFIDQQLVRQMSREYEFYSELIKNLDNPARYLTNNFDKYKPISLPYAPEYKIIDVDIRKIKIMDSYTKPVVIPFTICQYDNILVSESDDIDDVDDDMISVEILFKNESIINDVIVLNLMTICDNILREQLCNNFHTVTYPVMPLSLNSGMIEIISDAKTLHDISKNGYTIYQYIMGMNEDKLVSSVMDNYMYSLISYTLHSYFLGLGDRHMQNIMITVDGSIFHIDFGFILGSDVFPLSGSDIKLNSSMLDAITGPNSERPQIYTDLCSKGVILLRKYYGTFFVLLSQGTTFDIAHIESFIKSRFQPRQTDSVIVDELLTVISYSSSSLANRIIDMIKYHTHEGTVSKKIRTASCALIGY